MLALPCPWSHASRLAFSTVLALASLAVPCLARADVGTEALPDYLEALREDPVFTLQYLFLAGNPPAYPGPLLCGGDETPDELGTCSGPPPGCSKASP